MLNILSYVMVPVFIVAVAASIMWLRNRQPSSLEHGVDSFRREMNALSPDAAPQHRRPTEGEPRPRGARPSGPTGPTGPRRPRSPEGRS